MALLMLQIMRGTEFLALVTSKRVKLVGILKQAAISSKVSFCLPTSELTMNFLTKTASPILAHSRNVRSTTAFRAFSTEEPRVKTIKNSDGICHVVLNRPDKLNGFDIAMFDAIAETAANLRDDRSIRAIILRGEGRAFSAGIDAKAVQEDPQGLTEKLFKRPSGYGKPGNEIGNLAQDVCFLWREIPAPVIAAVDGFCFGAGFQLALGADIRYATPDSQFSIMETKLGLIPDMAGSILLRELVRMDVARDLTQTGRIVSGEEAASLGLVTKVCEDPLKEAESLAKSILTRSPDAIAKGKELYQRTWLASEKECLEVETELQLELMPSWNQIAATSRAFGWKLPYKNRS